MHMYMYHIIRIEPQIGTLPYMFAHKRIYVQFEQGCSCLINISLSKFYSILIADPL